MIDIQKFKDNSVFIIPYIINDKNLLTTNALRSSEIINVGLNKYIRLLYDPKSISQRYWLYKNSQYEKNFDTKTDVEANNIVLLEVLYKIPECKKALTTCIELGGYDILTKQNVVDNAIYWGVNSSVVFG